MAWTNHSWLGANVRHLLKVAGLMSVCASSLSTAGPLDSVPAGRWYEFTNSHMTTVAASPSPPGDVGSIIYAWGTGIYDTDRERLVVWGGGHGNYAGNEVYAFGPLTSATPRWERLTDPSTPAAENTPRGSDGRPVSRHTYNLLTYLPAPHNKMMSCAVGSQYSNGYGVGGVDFYDFTVNGRTAQPWSAGPTAPSNSYPYSSYCIYNPLTQSVWYQDNGSNNAQLQEFKLATQSWTSHVYYNPNADLTPAVDTKRNLLVTAGSGNGVQVYDPTNPKAVPVRVITSGPKAVEEGRFPGFVYDPVNDQFVGWNGGSAIYTLKAPADVKAGTWVWSQLALDAGNTVTPTGVAGMRQAGYVIGTYGRFRYVPSQKGVVLVNAADESVYFFKLPGSGAPLPSINLSASPTSVAVQGTSTLTWSTTNAASCTAAGAWTGAKGTSGSEARGPLTANSAFTLTCNNGSGGTANKSVTVNVATSVPAPTVDLNANPTSVQSGGPTSLSWMTSNASNCTASNGWSGSKAPSGSENIAAVNQQTTYTLTCTGPGGTQADSVTVSTTAPVPAPVVSLTSSAASVTSGSNVTLNWNASNATGCTANGGWSGNKAVSGAQSVGPLSANATFGLSCSGSGGSGSKTVSVSVSSIPPTTGTGPLAAAPAGRWYEFGNSRMDAAAPSPTPPGDVRSIIYAWGTGIYDTDRERLVVWGGGHNNYAGNEVYAFGPLTSATPRWERLTDPSTPAAENTPRGSDGRPVSRHTYNLLTYLPAPHNKMMSCAVGSQYSNGYGVGGVDFYNFTVNGRTAQPWSAGPTAPSNSYPYNSYCIYNPLTQSVWYQDNGSSNAQLQEFKLATQTWTSHVNYNPNSDLTPAVDTKRNLLVTTGANNGVQVYDPTNPKAVPIRVITSGPKAVEEGRFPGFVYDAVNDQFVGWNGGSAIYTLKVPADVKAGTWVWSQLALDAGNTVTPTGVAGMRQAGYVIGTYGRFRYVPSLQGVVLVNAADESVYFFKLPGGSTAAPLPSINLTANPTTVAAQGNSTLSWSTTNAASCAGSGAWTGAKATAGTEARGPLTANSNFTLTCTNSAGSASKSVAVTVTTTSTTPAPVVTLQSSAAKAAIGTSVKLTWGATNSTGCTASGSWAGNKAASGSQTVGPLNSNSNFVLSCSGAGGSNTAAVPVTVVPLPTMTLTATPTTIQSGTSTRVSWSSTNTSYCTASGAWSQDKNPSGSQDVQLFASGTLSLTCKGWGAQTQKSVSIAVQAAPVPTPTPTPTPGNEVAKVNMISQAAVAQNNVPFTFGHVFKVGVVPNGSSLVGTLADGSSVPLQVDAKAKHPDGSLRHAVLSGKLSSLNANASQVLTLSTGAPTSAMPIALNSVLSSGYDTSVSLNLGGTVYTASARQALSGSNLKSWLAGPMVSEWIAGTPVKTAAGVAHPHLTAYFHVRAYAGSTQVRTDVVLENNWAFVAGPGNFDYTATVSVPGKTNYVKSLTHYSRTRWHKRFWWGSEPQVYAKLDKTYLQDTKAIPKYENVQPTEGYLNSVRRSTEPMSNGDHEVDMEATGYQPGIGPLPQWDAIYAVSTDVRAFDFMLANADGGTVYSTHVRDEKTGLPISIDNYPDASLADPDKGSPVMPTGGGSPYTVVWAGHQPSIGYLPYVVTGDYFYLEETQFWSAYNLFWTNPEYRNHSKGWWYTGSIRGQAWAYRSLAQAAYITPDAHPLKAYLLEKLSNNFKRDIELYVSPGGPHKNNLGAMKSYNGNKEYLFFDYFMSWVVQHLVDLGYNEVIPFRDYKLKFPIGIMGNGVDQYCFQAAGLYFWNVGPVGSETFHPDFKTMFANTMPGANPALCGTQAMTDFLQQKTGQQLSGPNGIVGGQTGTAYYFANLQPALASAYDSGLPGGKVAWDRGQLSGAHPDYRDNPIWAVMPRNK